MGTAPPALRLCSRLEVLKVSGCEGHLVSALPLAQLGESLEKGWLGKHLHTVHLSAMDTCPQVQTPGLGPSSSFAGVPGHESRGGGPGCGVRVREKGRICTLVERVLPHLPTLQDLSLYGLGSPDPTDGNEDEVLLLAEAFARAGGLLPVATGG
ncbi:unnamed protein product, partial [Discosporangium mesarthrocarpum]